MPTQLTLGLPDDIGQYMLRNGVTLHYAPKGVSFHPYKADELGPQASRSLPPTAFTVTETGTLDIKAPTFYCMWDEPHKGVTEVGGFIYHPSDADITHFFLKSGSLPPEFKDRLLDPLAAIVRRVHGNPEAEDFEPLSLANQSLYKRGSSHVSSSQFDMVQEGYDSLRRAALSPNLLGVNTSLN